MTCKPPHIDFWYMKNACSLATHITLYHSGLPFNAHQVPYDFSRNRFPDSFRSVSPKAKVPVIKLDGETITESTAILTAISQLAPDKHLLGSTPLEVVRAYEWLAWLSGEVHGQGYGAMFRPDRLTDDEGLFVVLRAKAKLRLKECYNRIEATLQGEHAVGSGFTVVDAFLVVMWRWGRANDLGVEDHPKFAALVCRVMETDAARKAFETEGLE